MTNATYQGLRIYSRVLSEEEILTNVRADALSSGGVTFEGSAATVHQTLTFTNGVAQVSLPLYGTGHLRRAGRLQKARAVKRLRSRSSIRPQLWTRQPRS